MDVTAAVLPPEANDDEYIVDVYAELFEGNTVRYGTEDGGSIIIDADWSDIAELHLTGEIEPIGVYPIDPTTGLCQWGCIDFDLGEEESLIHATNVWSFLLCEGITSWVERSRSKGYHLWVFTDTWVSPSHMRNALLYACEFMDAPTKEINPKQTLLLDGQVGNYVRLPYPGGLTPSTSPDFPMGGKRTMIAPMSGLDVPLRMFATDAMYSRNPGVKISRLAAHGTTDHQNHTHYKPTVLPTEEPYTSRYDSTWSVDEIEDDLVFRLSAKARHLFDNGTRFIKAETGRPDRSEALVYLAGQIARDGTHSEDECRAVLACADAKWGKYSERTDGNVQLDRIVERAFTDKDSFY